AVHQPGRPRYPAAVDVADALVPQADAEYRYLLAQREDNLVADAAVVRVAGARADDDVRRLQRLDFCQGHRIVAEYLDLSAQLAEVLHQVIGKRVVVVDNDDHFQPPGRTSPIISFMASSFGVATARACSAPLASSRSSSAGSAISSL